MKHSKNIARKPALVLAFVLLLGMLGVPGTRALVNPEVNEANFDVVAENDQATLSYNRREALLRVTSKETGTFFDTKAVEGEGGNQFTRNVQRSDLVFEYISNERSGTTTTIDNYSMAQEANQYEAEEVENGLRISYHLGEETLTLQDLPKYVPSQKMFEKVLSHLSETQRETVMSQYVLVSDRYQRRNDSGVAQLMVNRLYEYFYEVGEYTLEDFEEDNEFYGVELDDVQASIDAVIEYVLDGKDLVVTVPVDEIVVGGDFPITRIRVLPYLMSAKQGEEGYLLVPDGSGAIINFDNNRRTASNYSERVYGTDLIRNVYNYNPDRYQVTMPMSAIKYEDHAIIGIIEEGADTATITSEISGKQDEYNKIGYDFNILEVEQVQTTGSSNVTLPRYSSDNFNGDIRIRYKFIENDEYGPGEVDYVSIAHAYREYLLEEGMLQQGEVDESAKLHLELLGAIEKRQFFLGIPYRSQTALTTFEQMANILDDLSANGINQITAELVGIANGGLRTTNLQNFRAERVLGGESGLSDLLDGYRDSEIELFPSFYLTQVFGNKGMTPRSDYSRMLSGEYARVPFRNALTRSSELDPQLSPNLLSPHFYQEYLENFAEDTSDLNFENLGIIDLGSRIVADYSSGRDTGRTSAIALIEETLAGLDDSYSKLLMSNPNDYALKAASSLTDMPLESNNNKSFDYTIPFFQLVLDGVMSYSSPSLNVALYEEPEALLLRSIEYRSHPKFQLSGADDSIYVNTPYDGMLQTNYEGMKDKVLRFFDEYASFYDQVSGSSIIAHEIIGADARRVAYDNGVEILINYSTEAVDINGTEVPALGYLVQE